MVAVYALYALSAITAVFAQAGIPACATTCAGAAATAAGCSTFTDAACICNRLVLFFFLHVLWLIVCAAKSSSIRRRPV